jgi:hypothetical protein
VARSTHHLIPVALYLMSWMLTNQNQLEREGKEAPATKSMETSFLGMEWTWSVAQIEKIKRRADTSSCLIS